MSSYTRRMSIHGFAKVRELQRDVNLFVDKRLFKLAAIKQKELIQAFKMGERDFKEELIELISILLQGARPDEALEVVEDLLKMHPELTEFLAIKAILLHSMRKTDEAKGLQKNLKDRKDIPEVSLALLDRALGMPAGLEIVQTVLLDDKRSSFNSSRVPANYEANETSKDDSKPVSATTIPEVKLQSQEGPGVGGSKVSNVAKPVKQQKSAPVQKAASSSTPKQKKQKPPAVVVPAKVMKQANLKSIPPKTDKSKGQNQSQFKKISTIPAHLLPKPPKHTSSFAVLAGVDSDGEDRALVDVMPHDDEIWPTLKKASPQHKPKPEQKPKPSTPRPKAVKQKDLVGGLKVRSWSEADYSDETSSSTPSLQDFSEEDSITSSPSKESAITATELIVGEEDEPDETNPTPETKPETTVAPAPGFEKLRKILAEGAQKAPIQYNHHHQHSQEEADSITAAAAHWKLQAMEAQERFQMIQHELEGFANLIDTLRIEYAAKNAAVQAACDQQLREERSKVSKLKIGYNFLMSAVKGQADGLIPEEFFCPISLEMMNDPVITTSGQSYERSAIELLLKNRNEDPLTRKPCTIAELRTNHGLAGAIKTWKRQREALSIAKHAAQMYSSISSSDMMHFDFNELDVQSAGVVDDFSAPMTALNLSLPFGSPAPGTPVRSQSRMAKRFGSSYDDTEASSTAE